MASAAPSSFPHRDDLDGQARELCEHDIDGVYYDGMYSGRPLESLELARKTRLLLGDGYYAYVTERRTKLTAAAPTPAPLAPVIAATADDALREKIVRIGILNAVGLYDIAGIEVDRLIESADLDRKRSLLPELARLGAHGR